MLLNINNLNVYFKKRVVKSTSNEKDLNVVNNLSLQIEESEIFGLAGESGCGKSITAYSMMGILPQNAYYEGDIFFEGEKLSSLSEERMRNIRGNRMSMIFQEPMTSLNPVLTIGYQIAEVLRTHKSMSRRQSNEKAVDLLSAVKIPSPGIRSKEYPHQMSGGMRQRVMIAMAIACNPSMLIADEPTTALDVTIQAGILSLIKSIQVEKRMAVLLITHDLGIISENAHRTAIMYAGRVMEQAVTKELFHRPFHPYTIGLLNSLPKEKETRLNPIPGYVPRPEDFPAGCKFADRCSFCIEKCKKNEPQFMEIEKEHFVRCFRAGEVK